MRASQFRFADARLALLASAALAVPAVAADQAAPIVTAAAAAAEDEEIIVYGKGEVRQVTEIRADDIKLTVAGASPFVAIQKLPGVNFQSADPFGVYEWSTRITLRGFNQNQLGFTLDGVPLGDMSYGNTNGLHISRAIIPDNIGRTRVSQGAGALGTASVSNLGGTIEFYSRDPQEKAGVAGNVTYGESNTLRLFGTLDTGNIGGFKAYISAAHITADKWKGFGEQRSTQVNAKAVLDVGAKGRFTTFINFTDRKENDYQDFSLDMLNRLGPDWDNISNDWPLAVRVATIAANRRDTGVTVPANMLGTTYPAPFQTVDDAYFDAAGLRRDWLAGARLDGEIASGITAGIQGYYHNNKGQGSWITPYTASPGGVPLSFRTTEYGIDRWGVIGDISAKIANHQLTLTAWYELNNFEQARRFYTMGNSATVPATRALDYQSNPFFTQWNNSYRTHIFQYSVQDTFTVGSDVSITAGFKGQAVTLNARPISPSPGPLALGSIESEDLFLPQVGILWQIDADNELFAGFTENQRAFVASATTGPFATSAAGFAALRDQLRPEKSNTFEAGVRFGIGSTLRGVVTAYLVNFANRILAVPQGPGIVGNAPILSNVGDVRSQGVELGLQWRPVRQVSVTGSYAFNENTYRDDVINAAGVVVQAIRGRTVVDSPRHIANLEITYDDGNFYGRANANAMSKRFFTFSNDQSVGGRVIVDGKIGYRFTSDNRWLNNFAIEGTVTNFLNRRYVATIGSNGFGFAGDNQTLLPAAPRQFFVTLRKDY